MKKLLLIPARGGSKGIPGKNKKKLAGKPLIHYTIEVARQIAEDEDICVSTDSSNIIEVVGETGLAVPFKRPSELATDTSSSYDVIQHAIDFFKQKGVEYDVVVLLQPTSPFRTSEHLNEALKLYDNDLDMVVSVKTTKSNPYFNLYEENADGYLALSKTRSHVHSRQSAPSVYEYNGAIYIINANSLVKSEGLSTLKKIKKYEMPLISSLDIDEPLDWEIAEMILSKGLL